MDVELATNYDVAVSNTSFFDNYKSKKQKLETYMEEWETIHEALENL
jgi:hypothetical protein